LYFFSVQQQIGPIEKPPVKPEDQPISRFVVLNEKIFAFSRVVLQNSIKGVVNTYPPCDTASDPTRLMAKSLVTPRHQQYHDAVAIDI
jgi:hypothetical protein